MPDHPGRVFAEPTSGFPATSRQWEQQVRPEVLATFAEHIYGTTPDAQWGMSWHLLEEGESGPDQVRRQIAVTWTGPLGEMTATVLAYLPKSGSGVVPGFVGLNFRGNHTTTNDREVLRTGVERSGRTGAIHYAGWRPKLRPPRRGSMARRWPYGLITGRGYAVLTLSYLQLGPDSEQIFERGLHSLAFPTGQADRQAEQWGAIGMWAWALSRVMDGLEGGMIPEVDPDRVLVMGHSRLGKAALWAGAGDERFAGAISNNSGCMGAAASRDVGETPQVLAEVRPYWFARNFSEQVLAGQPLPVDQDLLLACLAPRPLYVASASEDRGADPAGEFESWATAARVWSLYGDAPPPLSMPAPGKTAAAGRAPLGYHLREGAHDLTEFDWHHFLDFADRWVSAGR